MNSTEGVVFVIDDDASMRRALGRLCHSAGLQVRTFGSALEFLDHGSPEAPACLVLDVRMPGLNGLDLQAELATRNIQTPIVFITGHGDIPMSVKAMKGGAVDFLTKPFWDDALLASIREGVDRDRRSKASQTEHEAIASRLRALTPRERQVFEMVVRGMLNKQAAADLGISEQTVKVHRSRVMTKMGATSVAELVQAAVKAGVLTS